MTYLLNASANAIDGEIIFFIVAAIVMIPLAVADCFILKKISLFKQKDREIIKNFTTIKEITSAVAAVVVALVVGCVMHFAFSINVFAELLSALVIIASALSAFIVTMCAFDLVRYLKIKRSLSEKNNK